MPDPFSNLFPELSQLTQSYVAEDFLQHRKRLREARMRWIDEHERPTQYKVEGKDRDGNATSIATPFQVGAIRYPDDWKEENKNITFKPAEETAGTAADLDELDKIILSAQEFMAPGIYKESPHPEIRPGEDYGEYVKRVGDQYERQAGRRLEESEQRNYGIGDAGGSADGDVGLRVTTADREAGGGRTFSSGSAPGREDRTALGSHPDPHGAGSPAGTAAAGSARAAGGTDGSPDAADPGSAGRR